MAKQRKQTTRRVGSEQTEVSALAKVLFQILQCLHHIQGTRSSDLPKAFKQKQRDLDRFMKPAQELDGSTFRATYRNLISSFFRDTVSTLKDHYTGRLETLKGKILESGYRTQDLQTAVPIALRWGKKNFRAKLTNVTVRNFQTLTQELSSSLSADREQDRTPTHRPPSRQSPRASTPCPTDPATNQTRSVSLSDSPPTPPSNRTHSVSLSDSTTESPPHRTPSSSPSGQTRTPASNPTRSPSHPGTTQTRSTLTSPDPSERFMHPFTPPQETSRADQPRNVKGSGDILSNFFPCVINFRGRRYRSAEHAYQHSKAMFLGDLELAEEIYSAVEPSEAKRFGHMLKRRQGQTARFRNWEMKKRDLMRDVLWAKSQQVPLFRDELLKTQNQRLTHILPYSQDRFWATHYTNKEGKTFPGEDVFAQLLTKLRDHLNRRRSNPPPPPTPPPQALNTPSGSRSPTVSSNRFCYLESEFPPLPPPQAERREATTEPKRTSHKEKRRQGRQVTGPQIHSHDSKEKNRWELPSCDSKVMILGDSNLSRVTKVDSPVNSVEVHAYHGAKLFHFNRLLTCLETHDTPSTVILSVGINSRDNRPQTSKSQMKSMAQSASKLFPKAQIYIPQINISPALPQPQQDNLECLNAHILELAGELDGINTIPKLPTEEFKAETRGNFPGVHWTTQTANSMMALWFQHLNL